jgi:hypothetical protein
MNDDERDITIETPEATRAETIEVEPETALESERRSVHEHTLDPISLAFGLIFAALGLLFLIGDLDAGELSTPGVWAALLAAAGCILIALGLRRSRR